VTGLPSVTVLDCGTLITQERTLIAGGRVEPIRIPIPAWLVRHPLGDVLFDTGLHPGLVDGPAGLGRNAKLFTPELSVGGTVGPRLAGVGVDPDGPLTVVLSHCHFDHVGGLCELPNGRLIVQADEWSAAMGAEDPGSNRALYDLGHDVLAVHGEHDVFGDRTVTCIPTPGHTCGHQSLLVTTDRGPVLLTADACYFTHTLDDERLPPFGFDLERQLHTLRWIRGQRDAGTRIVPGHDAAAVARFAPAPPAET
jgi:glyoxylase-like metal-dependent hydrolase (beta-lactamase superfamily II)